MAELICKRCRAEMHPGPLTHEEYLRLHPVQENARPDNRPPELLAAQMAMEAVNGEYGEAKAVWSQYAAVGQQAQTGAAYEKAERKMDAAWTVCEAIAERVTAARSRYYRLANEFATKAAREEYLQTIGAQEERLAARKAERQRRIFENVPERLKRAAGELLGLK